MSSRKFKSIIASVLFSGWAVLYAAYPNMWALVIVSSIQLACIFGLYFFAMRKGSK
jgi:hypothetical protein